MGNGWCLNNEIRIGISGHWDDVTIHKKGGADAAKTCEERCGKDAGCIGYLTEDGSKCQLIPGTTYGGSATSITGVDHEHRNYCWRKEGKVTCITATSARSRVVKLLRCATECLVCESRARIAFEISRGAGYLARMI